MRIAATQGDQETDQVDPTTTTDDENPDGDAAATFAADYFRLR